MKSRHGHIKTSSEKQGDTPLKPSRSAKKRESTALQKLGEELAALPAYARAELDLPEDLRDALDMHDKITDHEGARRQRQFIGKIMRTVDAPAIGRALAALGEIKSANAKSFHLAEQWRTRFLDAPDSETENLLHEFFSFLTAQIEPGQEENLRKLVDKARASAQTPRAGAPRPRRALFRELLRLITTPQSGPLRD